MEDYRFYLLITFIAGILGIFAVLILRSRRHRQEPSDPYLEALQLLVDNDHDSAFMKLQQAVKSGSAPADAYLRLGRLLREKGEVSKALQIHQSLTVKTTLNKNERIDLVLNLAADYEKLGKPERAIKILEAAARQMNVKDPVFYMALGRHYNRLDHTDKAYDNLKELRKLSAIDERHIALFLSSQAEKQMQNGSIKEARKLLQKALKHDPECAPALLYSGNIDSMGDDLDGAIEKWKQTALVSEELAGKAMKNLEKILFERGRFGDIERVYREILSARASDEKAAFSLALFFKKQGRADEAVDLLKEFLTWHPDAIACALLLISIHVKRDDLDAIDKVIRESIPRFSRDKTYTCQSCQFQSEIMRWHCPVCNVFDTFASRHEN